MLHMITPIAAIPWPTDITGWIAKEIMHAIYAMGSILLSLFSDFTSACLKAAEQVINDIVSTSGFMSPSQIVTLDSDALNLGVIANYFCGCVCNQTIFFNGLNAVVLTALCACVLRVVLKLWAIIWSGQ